MDNNISKAEFLRNCFKEMLDDGKPHRYPIDNSAP